MTRFLWQLVLVMSVAVALAQPAVAASGGVSKVRKAVDAIKQLADRGSATIATGAIVLFACANMLSCQYARDAVLTASDEVAGSLPIMQGATSAHQTQFFVLTPDAGDYSFSLLDKTGDEIAPTETEERSFAGSEREIQHVFFEGLSKDEPYLFKVRSNTTGKLVDERELRTLAVGRNKLRFAFASCMWDLYNQGDIWEQLVALNPDVIFFLGDNVYADLPAEVTSPNDLWTRYVSTRETLGIFRNKKLIPIVSTWDDHDFGENNSNRDYQFKDEALYTFKAFFISKQTDNFNMPDIGLASSFEIYGYNFFLMDNRAFRTPVGETPEQHFGMDQLHWMLVNLRMQDHAFIAAGSQFFGGYSHVENNNSILDDESFEGEHPERFQYFIEQLRAADTKVVFLSGDRHYAEVMAIPENVLGYKTHELTSSPIGTIPLPFSKVENPLRVAGQDSKNNFMLVEAQERGTGLKLHVTAYSLGGEVLFKGNYDTK